MPANDRATLLPRDEDRCSDSGDIPAVSAETEMRWCDAASDHHQATARRQAMAATCGVTGHPSAAQCNRCAADLVDEGGNGPPARWVAPEMFVESPIDASA